MDDYLCALASYVKPELAFSCEFSKFFGGVKRLCSSCGTAYAGLFELSIEMVLKARIALASRGLQPRAKTTSAT